MSFWPLRSGWLYQFNWNGFLFQNTRCRNVNSIDSISFLECSLLYGTRGTRVFIGENSGSPLQGNKMKTWIGMRKSIRPEEVGFFLSEDSLADKTDGWRIYIGTGVSNRVVLDRISVEWSEWVSKSFVKRFPFHPSFRWLNFAYIWYYFWILLSNTFCSTWFFLLYTFPTMCDAACRWRRCLASCATAIGIQVADCVDCHVYIQPHQFRAELFVHDFVCLFKSLGFGRLISFPMRYSVLNPRLPTSNQK